MKTVLVCTAILGFGAASLHAEDKLPQSIQSTLDMEYPGWNLAPISKKLIPLDARDRYFNLLHRDLDADGNADYAIALNYIDNTDNVKTAALAFLARKNDFREYTLSEIWLGSEHR